MSINSRVFTVLIFTVFMLTSISCGEKKGDETFSDKSSGFIDEPIEFEHRGEAGMSEMVAVTVEDSLYHDKSCVWLGSEYKTMSARNADKRGFQACETCLGGDE